MPINTIIYPVTDIDAAKAVFTAALGSGPTTDQPYYVGFEVDGQQVGLDPNGARNGLTGPVPFLHVADLAATRQAMLDAGATSVQDPREVGGGRVTATLNDPDGNVIGLLQDA